VLNVGGSNYKCGESGKAYAYEELSAKEFCQFYPRSDQR